MNFETGKQFKDDFGMTIADANGKLRARKKVSDDIFALKLYLNGLDIVTGEKAKPTKEERKKIESELEKMYLIQVIKGLNMTNKQKLNLYRMTVVKFPITLRVFHFKGLAITKKMYETGELF